MAFKVYFCTQPATVLGMEKENMTEQNLTGYPSIDRPWLKYYSEEALNAPLPEGSMYDYMTTCNAGRMNETALNYFGRKISHRQLQTEIDRCARALVASGVKPGDVVSLCMLAMPEMIYLLYAINKIGAVSNMVVLNTSEQEMAQQLSNGGKLVITVDVAAKAVAAAAKEAGVDRIVVIPVHTSMPFFVRTAANLKAPAAPSGVTSWANFIRQGQENPLAVCPGNTKAPAVIEYTGGTTGETKGAVISNRAANAVVFQYKTATTILHFAAGQRFLDVLPPFIAFGVFLGAHMPLCVGFENVVVPDPISDGYWEQYVQKLYGAYARARKDRDGVRKFESRFIFTPKTDAHQYFQIFNSHIDFADGVPMVRRITSEPGGKSATLRRTFFEYGCNETSLDTFLMG